MRTSYPIRSMVIMVFIIAISCTSSRKNNTELIADIPVCGTVQFSDGCSKELDNIISYGLALVHHMTYDDAEQVFDKVIDTDKTCFWGPWGKALTFIHPLWNDPPSDERMKDGLSLSLRALDLAKTEKELTYAEALLSYYSDGPTKTEKEKLKKFEEGWMKAHTKFPADLEAKSFYALTLIATADPSDKAFSNQLKAGKLAEEVLAEIADHPGAFHYIIHAYDVPGLSEKALQVANKYGTIAPEIPHALHMPSHIFTRLGMWNESIEWNKRSASAAYSKPVQGKLSMHYFHALDYMMYAYLQQGEDKKAAAILEQMKGLEGPYQPHGATAYTLAAAESRFLLERQEWNKVASLLLPAPTDFPWEKFPEFEALNHFASGLGAARTNNKEVAEKATKRLDELQSLTKVPYWADQIEIQKTIIQAWTSFTKGSQKAALEQMQLAAEKEWATQKHPITPGELLPARELLGDMLFAMDRPQDALEQYEMSMQRSPNRLNSLYGAAQSAAKVNDHATARIYYQKIVELTSGADNSMPVKQKSLEFLKRV